MAKEKDIGYKIRKIGELMGNKAVIRIGVDVKNGRIDLLSVDACISKREADQKAIIELPLEPDYIG